MNRTTPHPSIETDVIGQVLNTLIPAIEQAGFEVADRSASVNGLTLTRPDGPPIRVVFLAVDDDRWTDDRQTPPEISPPLTDDERDALPDGAPDASWEGRRDEPPYEPTPEDWGEYHAIFDKADTDSDFPAALPGSDFPVRDRHSPEALANIRRLLWGA